MMVPTIDCYRVGTVPKVEDSMGFSRLLNGPWDLVTRVQIKEAILMLIYKPN